VDLVARWIHVIAGIMWVGNSLLFNWLDRSLSSRHEPFASLEGRLREGSALAQTGGSLGTIWLLHSGGFYFVEKTLLAGEQLPKPLHWFKWQAYTTWLTGAALLLVVYYLSDRAVLADPAVHAISRLHASALGLLGIALGWALYESMQRF